MTTDAPAKMTKPQTGGQVLVHRIRFLAAMAMAAAVFWHFGWWVAHPADPLGSVSLLSVGSGVVTMAELLALSIVVSGLAVAICGGDTPERGPLAVAVGLATLAARGGRIDVLFLDRINAPTVDGSIDAYPMMGLIAEAWLWLALIAAGMVVGKWVQGWFIASDEPVAAPQSEKSGLDIRQAVGALVIGFFVAWTIVSFAAGEPATPIATGQLSFALILAFLMAALIGQWFFDMRDRIWMLAVVGLVATFAYWFGEPADLNTAKTLHTHVAVDNPLIRALPIEYAALGAIGVLLERDFIAILFVIVGYTPREKHAEPVQA